MPPLDFPNATVVLTPLQVKEAILIWAKTQNLLHDLNLRTVELLEDGGARIKKMEKP